MASVHSTDKESEAHRGQSGQGYVPIECSGGNRQLVPIIQSPLVSALCSLLCVHRERRLKLFKIWKLMKYEKSYAVSLCALQFSIEPEIVRAPLWV